MDVIFHTSSLVLIVHSSLTAVEMPPTFPGIYPDMFSVLTCIAGPLKQQGKTKVLKLTGQLS